jgi:ribosomal protein S18 acetylase RimI-like enzyme
LDAAKRDYSWDLPRISFDGTPLHTNKTSFEANVELKTRLNEAWNANPHLRLEIARKNGDQIGQFLIGQIDGVLMASVMIGYDGHRGSVNFLAVDPDYARTGYGKILMAEVERFLLSVGCPKINFCVRTDNAKVVKFY